MDDQTKALASMLGDSQLELELGEDDRFKLRMSGTDLEGSYKIEGEKVTLTYETLMGMSLKDSNSPLSMMSDQFKDPEIGTVQEGGKKLFFPGRRGQPDEAEMTFTREAPKAAPTGPKSVSEEEAKFVGSYVFDDSFAVPIEGTKAEQSAKKMLQSMMRGFRLVLREDNTFEMTMMLPMKGKWKSKGGKLNLNVTAPDLKALSGQDQPAIEAKVSEKPGQLLMVNDKTGKVDFAIKRN